MQELEGYIADVMGARMSSLGDLRSKLEKLSELHRKEEDLFKSQVSSVLAQSEVARVSQAEAEESWEAQLKLERVDRAKTLLMVSNFKKEGAAVIQSLKDSLKDVHAKWKAEVERNAKLTTQLRKYEVGMPLRNTAQHATLVDLDKPPPMEASQERLQRKIETLTSLLEEEDSMIVELQKRNRELEGKVRQTGRALEDYDSLSMNRNSAAGQSSEFSALVKELRVFAQRPPPSTLIEARQQIESYRRFSSLLMQSLHSEQRQRLLVEEQGTKMAEQQDQLITKLEQKVKDLSSCTAPYNFTSEKMSPTVVLRPIPPPAKATSSAMHGTKLRTAEVPREPKQPALVGLDHLIPDELNSTASQTSQKKCLPTLEEQLAAVTAEFQLSLKQWSAGSNVDAGVLLEDHEFFPDGSSP